MIVSYKKIGCCNTKIFSKAPIGSIQIGGAISDGIPLAIGLLVYFGVFGKCKPEIQKAVLAGGVSITALFLMVDSYVAFREKRKISAVSQNNPNSPLFSFKLINGQYYVEALDYREGATTTLLLKVSPREKDKKYFVCDPQGNPAYVDKTRCGLYFDIQTKKAYIGNDYMNAELSNEYQLCVVKIAGNTDIRIFKGDHSVYLNSTGIVVTDTD